MSQTQIIDANPSKWGVWVSILIIAAAFVAYVFFPLQPAYLKSLLLVAGFVAAAVVYLVSPSGKNFIAFAKDAVRETKKVVWPTRKEVLQMAGVVFLFVFVMALFILGVDKTIEWVLYDLILRWKK
ncbi:MAG: preprotein translocase subunit SecE [Burkholderiales bacterium]|jgi:preprotein translocase subunit SecE|nr:preprotein translocase subunit SecE [Burkholderiales bacterium]